MAAGRRGIALSLPACACVCLTRSNKSSARALFDMTAATDTAEAVKTDKLAIKRGRVIGRCERRARRTSARCDRRIKSLFLCRSQQDWGLEEAAHRYTCLPRSPRSRQRPPRARAPWRRPPPPRPTSEPQPPDPTPASCGTRPAGSTRRTTATPGKFRAHSDRHGAGRRSPNGFMVSPRPRVDPRNKTRYRSLCVDERTLLERSRRKAEFYWSAPPLYTHISRRDAVLEQFYGRRSRNSGRPSRRRVSSTRSPSSPR